MASARLARWDAQVLEVCSPYSAMDRPSLCGFGEEWRAYLRDHGHDVLQTPWGPDVVFSVNGQGRRYRWLLEVCDSGSFRLTTSLRKHMRRQARLSRIAQQDCFLAVRFSGAEETVVVLPATEALRRERLTADRGGIPWGR